MILPVPALFPRASLYKYSTRLRSGGPQNDRRTSSGQVSSLIIMLNYSSSAFMARPLRIECPGAVRPARDRRDACQIGDGRCPLSRACGLSCSLSHGGCTGSDLNLQLFGIRARAGERRAFRLYALTCDFCISEGQDGRFLPAVPSASLHRRARAQHLA